MFIYRWGFIGFIITTFFLSGCNSQNNPLFSTNNNKSQNAATADSGIGEDLGIQSISSTSSPTPALEESNTTIKLPNVNPLKLEGELNIGGSTTLYYLSQAIAERFIEEGYPGKVEIASAGTAKGFQIFCSEGKLDILNAYRPINNQEIQACNQAGRQPISFPVAMDALTVVVSSQNDFLPSNLSSNELKKILISQKWSDVNKDWPDREIRRIVQSGKWTGVSALFVKNILNGNLNQLLNAPNTKLFEFEEEVIQDALINPDVISMIGYTTYKQNQKELTMISIDGIAPNETKTYPFLTQMFIYADAKMIRKRPEVQGFINFYLTNVNEEVSIANSLPLEETALNTAKSKLLKVSGRAK
jgi:phosphate transport system substrate-binding protein